jgi:hypothetical protein
LKHFVEFVRLRVQQGREQEFVANRAAAITAIADRFPDFVGAPVNARVDDHEWVDVWIYLTQEAAETANAQAETVPDFMAYAALAEIVSIETGTMPVGDTAS